MLVLNEGIDADPEINANFNYLVEKFSDLIEIEKIELREILDESSDAVKSSINKYEYKNVT